MVRNYKRKTERADLDEEAVVSAVNEVIAGTLSIRKSADKYGLKPGTLQHRIEKRRKEEEQGKETKKFASKYTSQQVFTAEQENMLTEYIVTCSKMHYGLTLQQVKTLAYEYAKQVNSQYPSKWDETKSAGTDWVSGFRKRNASISLRKPENTSAARSFSFNKTAVGEYFNNLEAVLVRYKFTPDRIINFDETGISTVLNTPKVLADKKQRQVGQIVSAERGDLVTFCGIVSAIGNPIPPIFIFPRVHYKEHFLNGAPEGSVGLAVKSGWMNADLFLVALQHVQKHTSSTKDNPVLLLCDNHESHISIEAINFKRENGIVTLTFPPHTSHKLQPLDVGVFGPFKGKLKIAFNDWHLNNPGKTLSIYDIPKLAKIAYFESFTGKNITNSFNKPGIWPFNKLAFSDEDFAPVKIYTNSSSEGNVKNAEVLPTSDGNVLQLNVPQPSMEPSTSSNNSVTPSNTSDATTIPVEKRITSASITVITPDAVRPYPKVPQREEKKRGRERGKSRIYTDTPEKNRLEELRDVREKKKLGKERAQRTKDLKKAKKLLGFDSKSDGKRAGTAKRSKRARIERISTSSSDNAETLNSSKEDSPGAQPSDDDDSIPPSRPSTKAIQENDFLLIQFEKKKSVVHYIGKVIAKHDNTEYQVSYLRKKPASWTFAFPKIADEACIDISDVVIKLPEPSVTKGTNRAASLFKFAVNLCSYDVQ